ncbi:MAG: fibrinogen-like YCDxxxxGGGW domain-containing protein [Polyangiaceae bacterium]
MKSTNLARVIAALTVSTATTFMVASCSDSATTTDAGSSSSSSSTSSSSSGGTDSGGLDSGGNDSGGNDSGPTATCTDAKKNGSETDVDCGGSCATKCADGKGCATGADCVAGLVCNGSKVCVAPTCADGAKNGTETDVDCGGSCSTKCADNKGCSVPADCTSTVCTANKCVATATACADTVKNGTETDVDCGGACATKCADNKACLVPADCVSTVCTANKCIDTATACADTVKNGTETDVDCGGACATKCAATKACKVPGDCASGICTGNVCQYPKDCSEIKSVDNGAASGKYMIDPDGAGGVDAFDVWCDMGTDGGGWTIVSSHAGADGQQGFTSDVALTAGNALNFEAWNLTRAQKVALSALETESIFVRTGGLWIKANKPMFDADLTVASKDKSYVVTLTSSSGAVANNARIGWTNYQITGGGDYGVVTNTFDFHNQVQYRYLNNGCGGHYLYSYSNVNQDGDAAYNVNTALGGWTATAGCSSLEGGSMKVYAAMRRP